jgi:hypothetical protein
MSRQSKCRTTQPRPFLMRWHLVELSIIGSSVLAEPNPTQRQFSAFHEDNLEVEG